jgi:hypothetical protein
MSAFGEVDANLMGAPGLEPDLAEARALEPSQNANVGYGELAFVAPSRGGTAEPIAPIRHQAALDGSVFDPSVGENCTVRRFVFNGGLQALVAASFGFWVMRKPTVRAFPAVILPRDSGEHERC